jgi:hypothetical protein
MPLTVTVKKLIVMSCLVIAASYAFAQKVIKTDTSHSVTLHIDPSNAMGGNVADVFEQVNYIPLETTPESLFGRVSQLVVVDNYYIILDQGTNCILIFNKDGKFHAKIKCKKEQGGGRGVGDIYVNRWTKQILFSEDHHRTLTYCDFDGKQIKVEEQLGKDINPTQFYFIGPAKLIQSQGYRDYTGKEPYYKPFFRSRLFYIDGDKVYARGLTYTEAEGKKEQVGKGIGPLSYFGNDTSLFYSEHYKSTVNIVTPTAIRRAYQFVFPLSMTLPADFTTNPVYDTTSYEYIQKHKEAIFSINNFYKGGDNLLFEAYSHDFDSKNQCLIYNLKSGTLVSVQHITPDDRSYFLPIYGGEIYGFDGEYAYTSISSLAMFRVDAENKDKNVKYNPALTNYFTKGTKKDNPVIVQFKVKDKL